MRTEHDVGQLVERVVRRPRIFAARSVRLRPVVVPHIDRRPGDHAVAQGVVQRRFVDHRTAADVDREPLRAEGGQLVRADQAASVGRLRQRGHHDVADLHRYGDRLVDALLRQRDNGRVLDVGVSVYDPDELALLDEFPALTVVQHPFNLLDRRLLDGDWLARLRTNGTKLQIRSVLLQGLLAMSPADLPPAMAEAREAVRALRELLGQLDLSLPDAAIAFAASLGADRVIVAANSASQLEELLEAVTTTLPDDLRDALDTTLGAVTRDVYDPRVWPQPARST